MLTKPNANKSKIQQQLKIADGPHKMQMLVSMAYETFKLPLKIIFMTTIALQQQYSMVKQEKQ